MKKAIVVGGAGFVGSAVVRELIARGVETWAVVRPGFGVKKANHRLDGLNVHIIECDLKNIKNMTDIFTDSPVDVWYQFAWDGLFNGPLLDYTTQIMNVKYAMDAVETAAKLDCRKFIGAGSISQYELERCRSQVDRRDKHQVYKAAKAACEYMGLSVAAKNGISFIWPIITNIFGPGENSPRLINTMIRNLIQGKRQSLSEGNQYYDFIYISDAAAAFVDIGESGKTAGRYVIGSGQAQPLKNFLFQLRNIVSPNAELGFGEMEFNGIYLPKQCYDITELTDDTGFMPKVVFAEGIKKTAEWIRKELV
ncbi:MAG: NAD-dependent epimerase/dehydratase family protein [Oscillospiraceae bacterium]|jgi:nucleoside-diphosphate-sugar epimerase|nr:NAD-dependent epimerase/dehydratase family protein [Oscillospiraceae bacterium]